MRRLQTVAASLTQEQVDAVAYHLGCPISPHEWAWTPAGLARAYDEVVERYEATEETERLRSFPYSGT